MNGNESSQKLNARELTEEIERATNLAAEMAENEQKTVEQSKNGLETANRANLAVGQGWNWPENAAGLGRERARAIGGVMLSGNANSGEGVSENVTDETERRLNAERVEQMVAAENMQGEEQRLATTLPTVPEALIMPQVQGKIDKTMVRMLGELTEKEADRPGTLDAKVNDLRRQYRVSWETGR